MKETLSKTFIVTFIIFIIYHQVMFKRENRVCSVAIIASLGVLVYTETPVCPSLY